MSGDRAPVTAADVRDDNPQMLANHLRALQTEMRSGFELLGTKLLTAIERFGERLDDYSDRLAHLERDVAVLKQSQRRKAGKK